MFLVRAPLKLHLLQAKDFSPLWASKCDFRLLAVVQEKSHWLQVKGFFPVCVSVCALRLLVCVHVYLHCLQLNGFSPVWAGICIFRSAEELNEWAHILQPWDFSPSAIGVVSETDDIVKKSILSWAETSGRRCQPMLSKKILLCLLIQLSLVCNKVQGRLQENLKYNIITYPYKKVKVI